MGTGLKSEVIAENSSNFSRGLSWFFGFLVFIDGLLNIFRGNDPVLGVAFLVVSLIYLPPVNQFLMNSLGIKIPVVIKVLLGVAIVWVSIEVGAVAEGFYPEITG